MNHIEFYEKIMANTEINYDTRHYVKQFYAMDLTLANDTVEEIFKLLRLKKIDLEVLKRIEKNDIEHN